MATVKNVVHGPKTGRPSSFTQATADSICDRIADGESLRRVCSDVDMPDKMTVLRWLGKDENAGFRSQYAHACEERGVAIAEMSLDEARAAVGLDAPGVAAQRLIVDTMRWHAAKLSPKKYGDKLQQDITITENTSMADRMKAARERASNKTEK